jgi:uncharacterized protein YoaH (UPF0181 family)
MGYRDAMGTSARNAGARVTDHAELGRLAEEQSALRRVATLVAQGASSTEVFAAVAQEVVQVLDLSNAAICRYDDEGSTMTVVAVWGDRPESVQPGSRWPLDGPSMSAEILRTGRPARFEDYSDLSGSLAAEARQAGFISVAGAPIIVDGRVWGLISTSSPLAPLPDQRTVSQSSPSWWRPQSRIVRRTRIFAGLRMSSRRYGGWRPWWRGVCRRPSCSKP